ncbi:unnamed protein product [Adineta ricciae]|uniref:Uncharacterized protein n=1 Tax=Adineta ricciae TaxID=249248 RepID=A0A815VYX3_ADIRI|nr:unnamed protein product [Adineta ricciae]
MMFYFTSDFAIFALCLISSSISIRLYCYPNADVILPRSTVLYNNATFGFCRCSGIELNASRGFQYNQSTNSCYILTSDVPISNIRMKINSIVCFINSSSTLNTTASSVSSTISHSPFFNYFSTSVTGGQYFQEETVSFQNSVVLSNLTITIMVQKTSTLYNPSSYDTTLGTMTNAINDTGTEIVYTFKLINGRTLVPAYWKFVAQFSLNNQMRNSSNDTYSIQVGSYEVATGNY